LSQRFIVFHEKFEPIENDEHIMRREAQSVGHQILSAGNTTLKAYLDMVTIQVSKLKTSGFWRFSVSRGYSGL